MCLSLHYFLGRQGGHRVTYGLHTGLKFFSKGPPITGLGPLRGGTLRKSFSYWDLSILVSCLPGEALL